MRDHTDWLAEIYGQSFGSHDDLEDIPEFAWCWIGLYEVAHPSHPEIIDCIELTNKEYEVVDDDALPDYNSIDEKFSFSEWKGGDNVDIEKCMGGKNEKMNVECDNCGKSIALCNARVTTIRGRDVTTCEGGCR